MPQHAPAELDRRGSPRVAERAPRRVSAVAAPAVDDATAQAVQRVLDESPRVVSLGRMGDALAQRRGADGPVVQRRVGPDEGRPGMEVLVRGTGVRGSLVRPATGSSGESVGWVVQTPAGVQNLTFDDVDPAPPSLASSLLLSSLLPPSLPPPPPTTVSSTGPSPPSAVVTGSGREVTSPPTSSASAPVEPDSVVREGDGVQFSTDGRNWHDGYVTQIKGTTYHVFIDSKIIREMYPYSTVLLTARQVRTSPAIKERMGAKRTKTSKREYRADRLASEDQVREVQGQYATVSPLLLRHPVLFGPVLRSGGHIGTEAVSAVGKDRGLSVTMPLGTKGKSRNRTLGNAIVATDTNAMLVTRLDDLTTGPGQWTLHGKSATDEAADHPTLTETQLGALREVDLAAFRRRYVFSQGSVKGESVSGIGKRTQMHAEAKAVRSRTWRHIVDQTVAEFTLPASSSSASTAEPARETRRKIIGIVINRSSCGSAKKGSGFTGGCAQELAEVIAAFWAELGERLGAERAARLRAQGNIRIEVSAAGQYEYEGAIERTARAGARLALHPNYDFDRDMPEPMSISRYQYIKRLALINAGRASGSDSGSGASGEEDSELEQLLALLQAQRASIRRPRARVALPVGQHQVRGMFNRGHSGRIACTSIAACALEQVLNSPGGRVDQPMLMTLMAAGTDIDAELRQNLVLQAPGRSGSRGETSSPRLKRRATAELVGPGPEPGPPPSLLSGSSLPFSGPSPSLSGPSPSFSPLPPSLAGLLASLRTGVPSPPVFPSMSMVERPLPSPALDRLLMPPPPSRMPRATASAPSDRLLMPPPPPPRMLVESRPVVFPEPSPTSSSALLESSGRKRKAKRARQSPSEEPPEERYFAHDEVQAQFPGMRVDQAAIETGGPQYLHGVRGDYRRIARQLTSGGPRTGMLVTIGGATIMVANLSTRTQRRFALFDSHGQAIFEIYDTEQSLADAIEDLYPALPGLDDEMDAAWYATPYRPRV